MSNIADFITTTDLGTTLLLLGFIAIIGLALIGSFIQWIDTWAEMLQEEAEETAPLSKPTQVHKKGRMLEMWRTHHI